MSVKQKADGKAGQPTMATRTVRLDAAAEATLADLRRRTDLSISEVIRRSLQAYSRELDADIRMRPGEVYRKLGLPGEGGFSLAPASRAKEAVAEIIRKKHGR